MIITGIDPGQHGAIVTLDNGVPVEWMHMPVLKDGKHCWVDGTELARFLSAPTPDTVRIELVHSIPGNGVAGMFSFGKMAGGVETAMGVLGLPWSTVTPQEWKKQFGLIGKDKDASRALAIQRWPWWTDLQKKAKGQALADAAFIALSLAANAGNQRGA